MWVCLSALAAVPVCAREVRCLNINVPTRFSMLPNCNGNVMFSLNLQFAFGIVIYFFIIRVLSVGKYPY